MRIVPFTLRECEMLLQPKNSVLDKYQILQLYMVFGGIPFYWNEVTSGKSAFQNINDICFTENGLLYDEFSNLFRSLFNNYQSHEAIINALAKKAKGLTRDEIIDLTGLPNAGSTTRVINGTRRKRIYTGLFTCFKKFRNSLYQLVDFYSL